MSAYLKWLSGETLANLRRRMALAGGLCGCLVFCMLAGCVSLDPALKSTLRSTNEHTIAPAIECYKAHGGKDGGPLTTDEIADIEFEMRGFLEAIDAPVVELPQ